MKQIMIRYSDNKPLAVQLEEIAGEYGKRFPHVRWSELCPRARSWKAA